MPTFSITAVLVLAAVILFIIAFIVAVSDFSSNWQAWTAVGLAVFAAAHLPWRA